MLQFMKNFYDVFPEYRQMDVSGDYLGHCYLLNHSQTYLGGESYAGQYIPYFGEPRTYVFLTRIDFID